MVGSRWDSAAWRRGALYCWFASASLGIATMAEAQVAPQGATQPPGKAAPTVYEPGDVYLAGSRVYIFVDKRGIGHEHAVVGQLKQGRLQLDAPQNAGQLVFDMKSFAADTEEARQYLGLPGTTDPSTQQQVNANMLSTAVLDAAHFPTATFTVRSVTKLPQPSSRKLPQYQLDGDFLLHGATLPIQAVADAEENGGWIHLRGGFTMLQTQFGMRPFTKAFGAVGVADELKIYGDLWLSKQRQAVAAGATMPAPR